MPITDERRWQTSKEEENEVIEDEHLPEVHEDPENAVKALRSSDGYLGPVSKAAWTQACATWDEIAPDAVERV